MLPLPAWAAARTPVGLFYPYIEEENVRLVGVEAGGLGVGYARPRRTDYQ